MGGTVDNTSAATFIPEIWSDEIIAAYKKSLVMANVVRKMSFQGKKGDTVHVPSPLRGDAHAKAENIAVKLQQDDESEVVVLIDKHYEYSRMIEDITTKQALSSLRSFYTEDAGYALARQVDTDLFNRGTEFGDGVFPVDGVISPDEWVTSATFNCNGSGGLEAYAEDAVVDTDIFNDTAFRELIQKLDDNNVPMDQRCFVIPPSLAATIRGITRYVSSDFVNTGKVPGGKIGELYGVDIMVSTNCPVIETNAQNTNASNTVDIRGAFLIHKDCIVHAEQMGVRSQTQYKQEFLSDLFTADTIYGAKVLRPEAGFVLAVNDIAQTPS
jgi:N4-gp56 family major capsid protein